MIDRYDCHEISGLWTDRSRFEAFLRVELAHLKSLEGSTAPRGVSEIVASKVAVNLERISEIEETTRHDVAAFISSITEQLTDDESRYFHYGLTSSDVIDTALSLQINQSLSQIIIRFGELLQSLHSKASGHIETLCMGRSHGIYAEPTSFGVKLLGHYQEFVRRYVELCDFKKNELTAQFSGSIGNYALITPAHEKMAAKILGLSVEEVSTQVIPRDRHAKLSSILALLAQAIERLSVELRHLQRTEVSEVHEGFAKGQKGSSTMPHKKNPISSENLTGIARVIRSNLSIALDNTILWHERDISHSSAERLYLPDSLGLTYYALKRLTTVVEELFIDRDKMIARVMENDQFTSSYYLHYLLDQCHLKRDEIYPIVQMAAFGQSGIRETIESKLIELGINLKLPTLNREEIEKIYLKNAKEIFSKSPQPKDVK